MNIKEVSPLSAWANLAAAIFINEYLPSYPGLSDTMNFDEIAEKKRFTTMFLKYILTELAIICSIFIHPLCFIIYFLRHSVKHTVRVFALKPGLGTKNRLTADLLSNYIT